LLLIGATISLLTANAPLGFPRSTTHNQAS
jgi:hypothetical protein